MDHANKKKIVVEGFVNGSEFALTVIVLTFFGYYVGMEAAGQIGAIMGVILGAFSGFALGFYRLLKKFP